MSQYEIYIFILCLIVFVLLTSSSILCVRIIYKLSVRLIRCGQEDSSILEEHRKEQSNKKRSVLKIIERIFYTILCIGLTVSLLLSLGIGIFENKVFEKIPTYRTVNTGSMSYKHEKNTYLTENDLNDQIKTFDLIRTYKLPPEDELQLYDIVVYKLDDILVVHRIVGIEEPNASHPNERHFLLQGDASESPDRFPVRYSQMIAIYKGERTPFIGSFILFMQSPAGWLCFLLLVVAMIAMPLIDRRLADERKARLQAIGGM